MQVNSKNNLKLFQTNPRATPTPKKNPKKHSPTTERNPVVKLLEPFHEIMLKKILEEIEGSGGKHALISHRSPFLCKRPLGSRFLSILQRGQLKLKRHSAMSKKKLFFTFCFIAHEQENTYSNLCFNWLKDLLNNEIWARQGSQIQLLRRISQSPSSFWLEGKGELRHFKQEQSCNS